MPREAARYLEQIEQRRPGQASVLLALGYCHWQTGDLSAAQEQIELALQARPHHLQTRLVAAEFFMEQDQLDRAEKALRQGQAEPPVAGDTANDRDDRCLWLSSKLAERRGDPKRALSCLEQALAKRPFELAYLHRKAVLLRVLGRQAESEEAFAQSQKLEGCRRQLSELVWSGRLSRPTVEVCEQAADLCAQMGKATQATGWRIVARHLSAGVTAPVVDATATGGHTRGTRP